MPFEKGHKKSIGNKGGRRPSAYEEHKNADFTVDLWENDSKEVQELVKKIKSGKFAAKDRFALLALQGNERILKAIYDKLTPDAINPAATEGLRAVEAAIRGLLKRKDEDE